MNLTLLHAGPFPTESVVQGYLSQDSVGERTPLEAGSSVHLIGIVDIRKDPNDTSAKQEFLNISVTPSINEDGKASFSISIPIDSPPTVVYQSDLGSSVSIEYYLRAQNSDNVSEDMKIVVVDGNRPAIQPLSAQKTIQTEPIGTVSFGFNSSRNIVLLHNYLLLTPCIRNESEFLIPWCEVVIWLDVETPSYSFRQVVFKVNLTPIKPGSDLIEPLPILFNSSLPPSLFIAGVLEIKYSVSIISQVDEKTHAISAPLYVSGNLNYIEPLTVEDVHEWKQSWIRSQQSEQFPGQLSTGTEAAKSQNNGTDDCESLILNEYKHGSIRYQSCARFTVNVDQDLEFDFDFATGRDMNSSSQRMSGMLGILASTSNAAGLRICLGPRIPTWFDYDLKEETRLSLPDGTEEYICRLTLGPGQYNVALYGNTLTAATLYHITSRHIQGLSGKDPMRFLSYWVSCIQNHIPENAWVAGFDLEGQPLHVARAYYKQGLHIGKAGRHLKTAMIPWGGKEVEIDGEYEVLVHIPGSRWIKVLADGGLPPNAIPAGYESDGRLIYVSRAAVKPTPPLLGNTWLGSIASTFDSRESMCPGKCAPHMHGCNLAFAGIEVNGIVPFEVLVFDDPPPFPDVGTSSAN